MPHTARFGPLSKKLRRDRNLKLLDVARALGFSVAYISDVERERRAPYDDDKIRKLAVLLECEAEQLLRAARISNGIQLDTANTTDEHREAALALGREWSSLSSEALKEIRRIVEGH